MLNSETLFKLLQNNHLLYYMGDFKSPGSIPASLNSGMVKRNPELYEWVDNPIITGSLRFLTVRDVTYVGPGMVMENTETGARYFMLPDEYAAMMEQCVSDRNVIIGTWSVFKSGHAYSLRWVATT